MSDSFEGLYVNVLNSLSNPVFIKDDKHRWIFMNDAFCTFLGFERDDLLNKTDHDFFSKEESDIFWQMDDQVLKTGKPNTNEESLTNNEGEKHTLLTSKSRISDANDKHFILGVITDITDMKFEEAQMERKNLQIQAQKNEITSLVRQVHHHSEQNLSIINKLIQFLIERFSVEYHSSLLEDLKDWVDSMIGLHHYFFNSVNLSAINLRDYLVQLSNDILKNGNGKVNLKIYCDPLLFNMKILFPVGLIMNELLLTCQKQSAKLGQEINLSIHVSSDNDELTLNYESDQKIISNQEAHKLSHFDMINILLEEVGGSVSRSGELNIIVTIPEAKKKDRSIF